MSNFEFVFSLYSLPFGLALTQVFAVSATRFRNGTRSGSTG